MVYLFIKILISLQDIHESESEVAQSCPTLCDPWTVAHQAPLSMGFSRKEYWSGLPFPSPGDLPNPGIESGSPTLQADALTSEPPGKPPNVRPDTIKLVEENTGKTLFDINCSKVFLNLSPRGIKKKQKTDGT